VAKGAIVVSCANAEVRTLTEGATYFTNRKYPVVDVPTEYSGWQFAAHEGLSKEDHVVTITAPEGGKVFLLARNVNRLAQALADWEPDLTKVLQYTTNDPAKPGVMVVWSRNFKKGETVTLRGIDFPGFTVIAPAIELR